MYLLATGIQSNDSEENQLWSLTTKNTTYIIGIEPESRTVLNAYWGPRLLTFQDVPQVKLPKERSSQDPSITAAHEEFPAFGGLRYGPDVLRVKFDNGTRELDLLYNSSKITTENLEIILMDRTHAFQVTLNYSLDVQNDLIIRTTTLFASGPEAFEITKSLTAAFHVPSAFDKRRELITLAGAWACETQVQRHSLNPGTSHIVESTRGIPSAQAFPYFAISDQSLDGESCNDNEVYFGTIGWSGNWKIEIHTDIEGQTRVIGGIHDRDWRYQLQPSSELHLPPFVVGYTRQGLSGARKSLTNHIRDNPSDLIKKPLDVAPVLYNGWEAYGFDVTFENQKAIAKKAATLGAELFVLDDGWFHGRNSDKAGLGDWFPDLRKFPQGLKPLADFVHSLGMSFGLWFEPEMVNPDSDLYRKHPDWVYNYQDRPRHLERNQLVLNITNPDVYQYLLNQIVGIVKQVGVDFIKWDMNRPLSDVGSPIGEKVWIEHVTAFNALIIQVKKLTGFIRIESCCSGGGRADLSILQKVESCWPSDNTRPDGRLHIQYGASFVIPPHSMSCWVTDSPENDVKIPISYRFHISYMGALGIGSNLNHLSDKELEEYKGWISLYKIKFRRILQFGNLDWLVVPNNRMSYTAVTQTCHDNSAITLAFREHSPFGLPLHPIRLRRLIHNKIYSVNLWHKDPHNPVFKKNMSGSALMYRGLDLPYLQYESYSSVVILIELK